MPEVTKKKPSLAVALGGPGGKMGAVPKVMASGRGEMAQKIIDYAKNQGLTIEKDSDLAQLLIELNLGDDVPEEVFTAVAEILYFIYEVNSDLKN